MRAKSFFLIHGPAITIASLLLACSSESSTQPSGAATDAGAEASEAEAADAPELDTSTDETGSDATNEASTDASEGGMDALDDAEGPWSPFGLLSLNLHCLKLGGTGFATQQERFAAIAAAAHAEGVGAIAAQEICSNGSLDALELLHAALQDATGDAWSTAYAYAHTGWEGTPDEAEEGVGLLVRGTVTGVETIEYRTQAGLRRVAVVGTLPAALGGFRLASVHLEYGDAIAREAQARETAAAMLASSHPSLDLLVAGDFNALPGSPALASMADTGFVQLTESLGGGRIDHVLAHRASAVAATEAKVVFDGVTYEPVSDHPGMLVRLAPTAGQPAVVTRLEAVADVGDGNTLYVRGDVPPLSWDRGWPAWRDASGAWSLVLTEIPAGTAFAYKFLRNDADWQTGDNESGTGGQDHAVTPAF